MDTSKIIIGTVGGGRYTVTAPIVKEDYGLYLKIEGLELPATYEVDFSNSEHNGTSVTMIGNADGVLIPRQFIDSGKDIFAFLYHVGADYGRTIFKFRIPNKLRPDRTDEQPTPEHESTIDQAINALNNAVAQTAQDKVDADASAQSASADAERAEQARDTAEGFASVASTNASESAQSAVNALTSARMAEDAKTSAQESAQTASEKADSITVLTAQAQTRPEGSSASASYNPQTGVLNLGIPKGKDGTDGDDGYSPTANVSKSGKTATITITDKNGTTSAQVEDGTDGTDGVSPTVTITPITGGHRITITDADGEHSADVMDGTGNVDDVQINGTSIVTDGVANVPLAGLNTLGVVRVAADYGIGVTTTGRINTTQPTDAQIKEGAVVYRTITPVNQHKSVFYGLAKSAGDTTQSASSNAVGVYTEEAKIAIQKMLGIYEAPWELIREDTFTNVEETSHEIATDGSGQTFELTDIRIIFWLPVQDVEASMGDYGKILAYYENNQFDTNYLSAFTQTAGSAVKLGIASWEQKNGMVELSYLPNGTNGASKAISTTMRYSGTPNAYMYAPEGRTYTRIVISKVKGTGAYKLYGRRKWQ